MQQKIFAFSSANYNVTLFSRNVILTIKSFNVITNILRTLKIFYKQQFCWRIHGFVPIFTFFSYHIALLGFFGDFKYFLFDRGEGGISYL